MINRLSFLFDKPKRSYNEIGTLNLMILNNSIKQRYLYIIKEVTDIFHTYQIGCAFCGDITCALIQLHTTH